MLCPMKLANPHNFKDYEDTISVDKDYAQCEKAECEWWDKADERCSLRSIAIVLKKISQRDPLESL